MNHHNHIAALSDSMGSLVVSDSDKANLLNQYFLLVIAFSLSLIEMHVYAFIAISAPKLVAMVTPLCRLCKGVTQMNSLIAQTLPKTKLCIDMSLTTEGVAIL